MTRGLRTGIGSALLLCVLAVLLTVFWRSRQSPSAPQPVLTLLVNGSESVDVAPGTPLVFELTLSGERRGKVVIGSRRRPWYSMMRLRDGDGRPLPWPVVTHREPRAIAVNFDGGLPRISTDVTAVAALDWQRSEYTAWLAVSPDDTQQLSGTTRVYASLEIPWWAWASLRGEVRSPGVAIRAPADAGTRGDLKLQKLRGSAEFFLAHSRFDRAYATSKELAQLEPGSATAHILNGDALAGMNRRTEALDAYRRALTLSRTSYEEPTLLLERIARVLERPR